VVDMLYKTLQNLVSLQDSNVTSVDREALSYPCFQFSSMCV